MQLLFQLYQFAAREHWNKTAFLNLIWIYWSQILPNNRTLKFHFFFRLI
jgi:hypothetical protein